MRFSISDVTPVKTNRKDAARVVLAAYLRGELSRQIADSTRTFRPTADRDTLFGAVMAGTAAVYLAAGEDGVMYSCAIGQLYPMKDRVLLEGALDYSLAHALIRRGLLLVPDEDVSWFVDCQNLHDRMTCDGGVVKFLTHVISGVITDEHLRGTSGFYLGAQKAYSSGGSTNTGWNKYGLCKMAEITCSDAVYRRLADQFVEAGLDPAYPFNSGGNSSERGENYTADRIAGMTRNLMRKAWVNAHYQAVVGSREYQMEVDAPLC